MACHDGKGFSAIPVCSIAFVSAHACLISPASWRVRVHIEDCCERGHACAKENPNCTRLETSWATMVARAALAWYIKVVAAFLVLSGKCRHIMQALKTTMSEALARIRSPPQHRSPHVICNHAWQSSGRYWRYACCASQVAIKADMAASLSMTHTHTACSSHQDGEVAPSQYSFDTPP